MGFGSTDGRLATADMVLVAIGVFLVIMVW